MGTLQILSYLLQKQPYNPILWTLYSTCRFLRAYKPPLQNKEIRIQDYVLIKDFWLKGSFEDIRDFIAIDDKETECPPRMAAVSMSIFNEALTERKKVVYSVPCEWLRRIAVRDGFFVLFPSEFCCREILYRSNMQMIRCQSLHIEREYMVDETYFHIGCGPCIKKGVSIIEVFAATTLCVGLRKLQFYLETGLYVNVSEMVCALGRSIEQLYYYTEKRVKKKKVDEKNEEAEMEVVEYDLELLGGLFIRKYLAHILVCIKCHRYITDFLSLLDQSVEHHPFPAHREVAADGYNNFGIPILHYVLDADFDALRGKAFYGVINNEYDACDVVDNFMCKYVIKKDDATNYNK
ncbi:Hypothetical predicted protein [Paramuricea clavata]|uniref:Uncharacterized protein n=1 Tax=Paramuricea clavata TaxID=317549 RepID=A0A6S7GYV0_PARCT|nr:Hypothetical predicted protein [Paramuricea clavata]